MYERKFILTESELEEIIIESFVQGWYRKHDTNDDGKYIVSKNILEKLKSKIK